MNTDHFEFSISHLRSCSGNGSQDLSYVQFFCKEAAAKAGDAAKRLSLIADLAHFNPESETPIAATIENYLVQIEALAQTMTEFAAFFELKPSMAAPFEDAKATIDVLRKRAVDDYRRIRGWIEAVRSLVQ